MWLTASKREERSRVHRRDTNRQTGRAAIGEPAARHVDGINHEGGSIQNLRTRWITARRCKVIVRATGSGRTLNRKLGRTPKINIRVHMTLINQSILFVTYGWVVYFFWCEKNSDTRKHSINTRKELKVFRPGLFVKLGREIRCVGSLMKGLKHRVGRNCRVTGIFQFLRFFIV
jgi:hypothetical protein